MAQALGTPWSPPQSVPGPAAQGMPAASRPSPQGERQSRVRDGLPRIVAGRQRLARRAVMWRRQAVPFHLVASLDIGLIGEQLPDNHAVLVAEVE